MGIATNDNRESGGVLVERGTQTCHRCGAVIEYQSKPLGNFLRRYRVYKRRLPDGTYQTQELGGGEFRCNYHDKVLCVWCAKELQNTSQQCVAMEQVAEATAKAISESVNIWTPQGQHYVEQLSQKRIYLT